MGHSRRKLCPFRQVAQKMLEIFRGAVALIDEIDWVRSLVYGIYRLYPYEVNNTICLH